MANHHTNAACLDSEGLTRRNVLKALPLTGIAATVAVSATVAAEEITAAWEERIVNLSRQIADILCENSPVGVMTGFQFRCDDDGVMPGSIWATIHTDDNELMHARPGVYDGFRGDRQIMSGSGIGGAA